LHQRLIWSVERQVSGILAGNNGHVAFGGEWLLPSREKLWPLFGVEFEKSNG
jgi:hypothetical protein